MLRLKKAHVTATTMKPQFLDSNDPSMIRAWNRRSTTRRHARSQNLFSAFHTRRFRWLTQCFVHRLSPKDCTYPEKWQAKLTKYCNYHEECHSNFTKYYNENPSSYTGKFSTNLLWQVKHNVLLYVYIFFVCMLYDLTKCNCNHMLPRPNGCHGACQFWCLSVSWCVLLYA